MRAGLLIVLSLLACWFSARLQAAQGKDEPGVAPQSEWPGPLVELVFQDKSGGLCGYLVSYEGGLLKVRPLDGGSDHPVEAKQVKSLRFLPPPPPDDGRGRYMDRAMRYLANLHLSPPDNKRLDELLKKPAKLTAAETKELQELGAKMNMPELVIHRQVNEAVWLAQFEGRLEAYEREQLEKLPKAATLEERQRCALGVIVSGQVQERPFRETLEKMISALGAGSGEAEVRFRKMRELRETLSLFKFSEIYRGRPAGAFVPNTRPGRQHD